MSQSLFSANSGLDVTFLDEAYGDDAETASLMFQQYLDELPSNMMLLNESIEKHDVERFRHLIHKQKPVFSYVGLTDITNSLQDLQVKCHTADDMTKHQDLITNVVERINSSQHQVKQMLIHLQNS